MFNYFSDTIVAGSHGFVNFIADINSKNPRIKRIIIYISINFFDYYMKLFWINQTFQKLLLLRFKIFCD